MELFKRPSHQHEAEAMVRIDLTKKWYSSLMRSLRHDDARLIEDYVKARLQKDEKGYFIRAPYPDIRFLLGELNLLRNKLSEEIIKIIPVAFATMNEQSEKEQAETAETEDALAKFEALSRRESDLGTLIEVFFYQIAPEEHHPFGPR